MPPSQRISIRDALKLAVERHRAGDLAGAETLYRLVLQAVPGEADANYNLGTLARQKGNPADALSYFEAALRSKPGYETYALSYAETLIACERFEEALAQLETLRRQGHDSALLRDLFNDARNAAEGVASLRGTLCDAERRRLAELMHEKRFAEAEALLANALAHQDSAGHLWRFYAVVLSLQDKDARSAFEHAVALLPTDAIARRNLVRYLSRVGDWTQALEAARRLVELSPDSGANHLMAGNAAYRLGRLTDAAAHYRKALEFDAGLFDAENALGNVLQNTGQPEQAEAAYRRAAAIKPDSAELWCNLSVVCKALGRYDEATACCRKALDIDPGLASALIQAGALAIDDGRFVEAERLFKEAIAREPGSADAWAAVSRTRKMTSQDGDWARGAAALADSGLAPRTEANLRFALGKYFDDTRQFAQAFPQFHRANELNKEAWRQLGRAAYDEATHSRFIDSLIAHFNGATIAQPRFAHPSARPVLILGMPRSGTSLAEQILASHPDVHGAGELGHWGKAAMDYLAQCQSGKEAGALLPAIATHILRQLHAIAPDAKRIVDKMPNNFQNVGLIHAVFPNARIIHMQRNPVDVCLSIYCNAFAATQRYAGDLHHLAHYYREYERLMAHWRTVLPAGTMLDVPYEELVRDQEGWSRRMVEFVGLPWDERCLNFHENARAVRTPSTWQVRQKINASSVERWRHYEQFIGPLAALLPAATAS